MYIKLGEENENTADMYDTMGFIYEKLFNNQKEIVN